MNESVDRSDPPLIGVSVGAGASRDLRDELLRLALRLDRQAAGEGYLILVEPRITWRSLEDDFRATLQALKPELARRLHLSVVKNGVVSEGAKDLPRPLDEILLAHVGAPRSSEQRLPRPDMQSEVFRFLLLQWICGRGPLTSESIAREVGCNYRTVARTVEKLAPCIRRGAGRSIELARFPTAMWNEVSVMSRKVRHTVEYEDRSDRPRSVDSLYQRIVGLNRDDIAFGGIIGARAHRPTIDLVGTPRLDLCLHAFGPDHEPLPVDKIDPGLAVASRAGVTRLAVHFLRRRVPCFAVQSDGTRIADPVECLLDLQEAGFDSLAAPFLASYLDSGDR